MEAAVEFLTNEASSADLVRGCFLAQDTPEFQWAFHLYKLCTVCFPNAMAMKLLKFYLGNNNHLKTKAIQLLSFSLSMSSLSPQALIDLKPLLLACLREQTTRDQSERDADASFLRSIAYAVSSIAITEDQRWLELGDCLRDLANSEARLGFNVFIDLPPILSRDFLIRSYEKLLEEASKTLTLTEKRGSLELIAAFTTLVLVGVQLKQHPLRDDFISEILNPIGYAIESMLANGQVEILEGAVNELTLVLDRNSQLYKHNTGQRSFMFQTASRMISIGLPVSTQLAVLKMCELCD